MEMNLRGLWGEKTMARYIDANLIKGKLQNTIINSQTAFINTVLIGLLDKAPTEDVQKIKQGKWIDKFSYKYANQVYICSACKGNASLKTVLNELGQTEIKQDLTNYCPSCGAKMDGV